MLTLISYMHNRATDHRTGVVNSGALTVFWPRVAARYRIRYSKSHASSQVLSVSKQPSRSKLCRSVDN